LLDAKRFHALGRQPGARIIVTAAYVQIERQDADDQARIAAANCGCSQSAAIAAGASSPPSRMGGGSGRLDGLGAMTVSPTM
jgi:hypothetical protein